MECLGAGNAHGIDRLSHLFPHQLNGARRHTLMSIIQPHLNDLRALLESLRGIEGAQHAIDEGLRIIDSLSGETAQCKLWQQEATMCFNAGYLRGHLDTSEGVFQDIPAHEMSSRHQEDISFMGDFFHATDELQQRCQEILQWRKTGVLEGEALRSHATKMQEKFGSTLTFSEALDIAERDTTLQAYRFITQCHASHPLAAKRSTLMHISKLSLDTTRAYLQLHGEMEFEKNPTGDFTTPIYASAPAPSFEGEKAVLNRRPAFYLHSADFAALCLHANSKGKVRFSKEPLDACQVPVYAS